ncbi:MAG TPA: hypothetical protein VLC08_08520 [Chitinolyticbacter sp.]|nr:hypothetical protein [Chitinolyticbacter sp.]
MEDQIAEAMVQRLPKIKTHLVRPFLVECEELDTWVVARSCATALCISLETERFGVGFLSHDDIQLDDVDFFPSAELAVQSFEWALARST